MDWWPEKFKSNQVEATTFLVDGWVARRWEKAGLRLAPPQLVLKLTWIEFKLSWGWAWQLSNSSPRPSSQCNPLTRSWTTTTQLTRWNRTFNWRWPLMKDNLGWKTTFYGRCTLIEHDLWWKTTFDGKQTLRENELWWKTAFGWKATFDGRRRLIKMWIFSGASNQK